MSLDNAKMNVIEKRKTKMRDVIYPGWKHDIELMLYMQFSPDDMDFTLYTMDVIATIDDLLAIYKECDYQARLLIDNLPYIMERMPYARPETRSLFEAYLRSVSPARAIYSLFYAAVPFCREVWVRREGRHWELIDLR